MNQLQFEMICKILQNGAPALANELCDALNTLVVDYNRLLSELQAMREATEEAKAGDTESENSK